MRTAFQKQKSIGSRVSQLGPPVEHVGALTPVHVEDIVKDRNLDYLESLGELVERTPGSPMWYEYESSENKMKFLQIYQLSICYARNTDAIYKGALAEINGELGALKSKVDKLKSDILAHKDKTTKLRKQYRREKLNKEREKALHYQRSLKNVRDALHKQKIELEAKNERQLRELEEQARRKEKEEKRDNPLAYLQPFQPPPSPYYGYYPPPSAIPPQNYPYQAYEQRPQPEQRAAEVNQRKKGEVGKGNGARQQAIENIAKQTSSTMLSRQKQEPSVRTSNQVKGEPVMEQPELKKKESNELKESKKSKEGSNKTCTLRASDNIRQSNIESQKDDIVEDLIEEKSMIDRKVFNSENSKLSRKSSGMEDNELNSMLNVELKTESKNDIYAKPNKPALKKELSIVEKLKNSGKLEEVKTYDNKMSVKITSEKPPSGVSEATPESPGRTYGYGYLEQSNQGPRMDNLFIKGPNGITLKSSDKIGRSFANSMEDAESRSGSRLLEEDVNQTRINLNVDFSESSPEKQKRPSFAPLFRNYFILKDEAKGLDQSKYSSIGSLKEFSVKFMGSERRKTFQDKSQSGLQENNDYDIGEISMPMDSVIARPSKLKQSTIMKSKIQQKIHRSHDPKAPPTEFVPETPHNKKEVKFADHPKADVDDNFAQIKNIQSLESVKLPNKSDNQLKVPVIRPKAEEKLATVDVVQSQIIEELVDESEGEKGEGKDFRIDDQSLNLSVIEESENESLFTQQNSMKQKILLLIDRKHKQRGNVEFDKQIIISEIESLHKDKKEKTLSYEQIANSFAQLAAKKQQELNALVEERKSRAKAHSSRKTSKQNSGNIIKAVEKDQPNLSKVSEKKEEDDLVYSRSLLENPALKKMDPLPAEQSSENNGPGRKEEGRPVSNPKYIREQKDSNTSNRMLTKIMESSKYDQDDEIENTIKNGNFLLKPHRQQDLEDSF